jgi:hypothetical protein
VVVLRENLEFLGRLGTRLPGAQADVIGAEEVGQHPGVERIVLRSTLPKPIPGPVQRLGFTG